MTSGSSNEPPLSEVYADLGRLRVTITDLEALLARLYKSAPPEDVMLHAGHPLDSPDDLRTLTDAELRDLSVSVEARSPAMTGLVVHLRLNEASAQGVEPLVRRVEDWARGRQFRGFPPRAVIPQPLRPRLTWRLVALTAVLTQLSALIGTAAADTAHQRIISAATGGLTLVLFVLFSYDRLMEPRRVKNFALVIPTTLEEYRREDVVRKRYMITTSVAVGAGVLASCTAFAIALVNGG